MPVMMSRSAIERQPPARKTREGSSWMDDRCASMCCSSRHATRVTHGARVKHHMHHLHVLADFLLTRSHRFSAFALQMRQQQLGCGVTCARVIPVHPPVDLRALLRVLRVHLLQPSPSHRPHCTAYDSSTRHDNRAQLHVTAHAHAPVPAPASCTSTAGLRRSPPSETRRRRWREQNLKFHNDGEEQEAGKRAYSNTAHPQR